MNVLNYVENTVTNNNEKIPIKEMNIDVHWIIILFGVLILLKLLGVY